MNSINTEDKISMLLWLLMTETTVSGNKAARLANITKIQPLINQLMIEGYDINHFMNNSTHGRPRKEYYINHGVLHLIRLHMFKLFCKIKGKWNAMQQMR